MQLKLRIISSYALDFAWCHRFVEFEMTSDFCLALLQVGMLNSFDSKIQTSFIKFEFEF